MKVATTSFAIFAFTTFAASAAQYGFDPTNTCGPSQLNEQLAHLHRYNIANANAPHLLAAPVKQPVATPAPHPVANTIINVPPVILPPQRTPVVLQKTPVAPLVPLAIPQRKPNAIPHTVLPTQMTPVKMAVPPVTLPVQQTPGKIPTLVTQQVPTKLNGSQHSTNEHHIENAPHMIPQSVPVKPVSTYVAHNNPTGIPVPQPVVQQTPNKLNGSQHPTNEHHITHTPTPPMTIDPIVKTNAAPAVSPTTTKTPSSDLNAAKSAMQAINNNNNQRFKNLSNEINNNQRQANAGISGAMAMAGLPQVQANQKFMFSAGAGTYEGESALAVGASVNVNEHVVGKVSFSDDTANNMGASVGVGIGF